MEIRNGKLYVSESSAKGRGVFTSDSIKSGETIEVCPVVVLSKEDTNRLAGTILYDYYFDWLPDASLGAIALGFGSIYNHSFSPNAMYEMDFEEKCLVVVALCDIAPDEEICFNYNGDPDDQEGLWFETN